VGDRLEFRLGLGGAGGGGGGGGGGAPDDDFITLPASPSADNADYLLIHDTSLNAYRKQLRSVFLSGLSNSSPPIVYSGNHTVDINVDKVLLMNVGGSNKSFFLPDPTTCHGLVLYFKKIDSGSFSMIVNGSGFNIDGSPTLTTNTQYESFTLVADGITGAWWIL
jgi:hypothetical protein